MKSVLKKVCRKMKKAVPQWRETAFVYWLFVQFLLDLLHSLV